MTPKEFIQKLIAERDSLYGNWRGDADKKQRYYLLKEMVRQLKNAVKHGSATFAEFAADPAITNKSLQDMVKKYAVEEAATQPELEVVENAEEAEDQPIHETPEAVFKKMTVYLNMITKQMNHSLILCGAPGVGKTYRVKTALRAAGYNEGHNMITIKGRCAPRVLYSTLYEYGDPGDIVVIDDADGLVGPNAPEDSINILKAALDSDDDGEGGRLVTYGVSGTIVDSYGKAIPKRFSFKGSVIVITNWNAGNIDSAVRNRSYVQDIYFTPDDMLYIIKKLMPAIEPNKLSVKSKFKAYDYLKKLAAKGTDLEISIRTFTTCAMLYEAGSKSPDITEEDVQSMIREQMRMQSDRRRGKKVKH